MKWHMSIYKTAQQCLICGMLLFIANGRECLGASGIAPNMKPGMVMKRADLPKGVHLFGIDGRTVWGNGVLINWMIMDPGTEIPLESNPGDGIKIVWKGSVEYSTGGKFAPMKEKDCLYVSENTQTAINNPFNTTEIFEIYWPARSLFDGAAQKFPGMALTYAQVAAAFGYAPMARPWEAPSGAGAANPVTTEPSQKPNVLFSYYELQFCQPEKSANAKIIQGKRGQVCFVRLRPGEQIPRVKTTGEKILIVLDGSMEKTIGDSTVTMETGDLVYLTNGTNHGVIAGKEGCEFMEAVSPGSPEYTFALDDRIRKYQTVISPDAHPELMFDGRFGEPGLHCTEGPAWMNGTLYFSNYYYFWSMYGTKKEGGLNALKSDGSRTVINQEMQTCGVTPLSNGNLAVCDLIHKSLVEMNPSGKVERTIADSYNGKPFAGSPNDLVTDQKGGIYFTVNSEKAVFYLSPAGKLIRVTEPGDFTFPNGCLVSADGSRFFLNNTGDAAVWVFDINRDGTLSNKRLFAQNLFSFSADGIKMDRDENLYIATDIGIQVWDRNGGYLGHVYFPKPPFNLVFGGEDLSLLYATCRNQIYAVKTKNKGFQYPIR